jgi:hypothetical protein
MVMKEKWLESGADIAADVADYADSLGVAGDIRGKPSPYFDETPPSTNFWMRRFSGRSGVTSVT